MGKRLCSKVNSLLRDFAVIKAKLDAQRALASSRSVGNSPQRRPGGSQKSVDTVGGPLPSSRGKGKPRPSFVGRGQQRPTKLNPAANRRVPVDTSEGSEVDHPSLKEAMTQVPSTYDERASLDFKHITAMYKKSWTDCEDAYVFGVEFRKDISIYKLIEAPPEFNIRNKEMKLV